MEDRSTSTRVEEPQQQNPSPETAPPDSAPPAPPDGAADNPSPDNPPAPPAGNPDALLKAFGTAAKTAATAALRMGELALDYISARMLLSDACQRDACVKSLVSAWQDHADEVVTVTRVQQLIRTAAAWRVLNAGTNLKPGKLALRVIREFSPLLERDGTQRAETWRIVPALAERAIALWSEATSKGLNGEEVSAAVAKLVADHKAALATAAAQTAAAPGASAEDKTAADKAAQDATKAAEGAAKKGRRANKEKDETPATVKDGTQTPKPEAPCRGENLLATLAQTAKQGTGKDFAALLAQAALATADPLATVYDLASALASQSKTPDDALSALLRGFKDSKSLSKPGARAADAALVLLNGASKPDATAAA